MSFNGKRLQWLIVFSLDIFRMVQKNATTNTAGTNFCDYNCDFYKKLSLGYLSLRKLREAWRLTVLSSAIPSDGDGEAGFTDTLRPHADYGSRLNTGCLIRLVCVRQGCRTHKTSNRQPVFLTPAL